jgi:hypothetical protein
MFVSFYSLPSFYISLLALHLYPILSEYTTEAHPILILLSSAPYSLTRLVESFGFAIIYYSFIVTSFKIILTSSKLNAGG